MYDKIAYTYIYMSPQEDQMYIENKQMINPVRIFSLLYSPAVGLQPGGGGVVVPKNRKNSAVHKPVGWLPNENEDDNIYSIYNIRTPRSAFFSTRNSIILWYYLFIFILYMAQSRRYLIMNAR